MNFTTPEYYYLFIPVALFVCFIIFYNSRNKQVSSLLLLSYLFFYLASGFYILLLFVSTLVDFYCGKSIDEAKNKTQKKKFLFFSIITNLSILGIFKYFNFFIGNYNTLIHLYPILPEIGTINVLLPIGISFYTFQTMSYTIDIYREKVKPQESIIDFACYAAFFPQLVAGPIVRYSHFNPQITEKLVFKENNLKIGLTFIIYGLFKKFVIADNIAIQVNNLFTAEQDLTNFWLVWCGALFFGIQIYADFSAYTDIAIGSAKLFGIYLPENFKHPYFAHNPQEFWRKWHISLSTWLRDYLYFPLGGSKGGMNVLIKATMITMILGGLWHGASWNFIIWGLMHGIAILTHKIMRDNRFVIKLENKFPVSFSFSSLLLTQLFIFWTWLIFRLQDDNMLSVALKTSLGYNANFNWDIFNSSFSGPMYFHLLVLIPSFLIMHYMSYKYSGLKNVIAKLSHPKWALVTGIMLSLAILLKPVDTSDFIYFRF